MRLLELYKPQIFTVEYGGVACCGPTALPTFPSIYHQLGPTQLGHYKEEEQAYWLVYPGVTLVFPIPRHCAHMFGEDYRQGCAPLQGQQHVAMLLPDGCTPVASRIRVHPARQPGLDCRPPPLPAGSAYMEPVLVLRQGLFFLPSRSARLDFSSSTQVRPPLRQLANP